MALLVGEILANAARTDPHSVAATLGDESLTFGALDAAANQVAHVLDGAGVRGGDRVVWWGDTSLAAIPVFGALARLGAVFAPVNARLGVEEARTDRRAGAAPRAAHRRRARRSGARGRRPTRNRTHRQRARRSRGARHRRRRPMSRARPRPTRTSSSSRAGAPAGRRVSCSRTAPTGCVRIPGATSEPGGSGVVCMFPLFHMAGWTIALGRVAGPPAGPLLGARPGPAARDGAAPPRRTPVRDPCGVGAHPRARRRRVRPLDAARGRHRHVGDAARAHRRDQGRAPAHRDPHLLRIDRSRARDDPGARRSRREARRCRSPATGMRGAAERDRRGVRAQPVPDGRLLRQSRGDGRTRCATAGTTRAISARSTPTGYLSIVGRARDVIRSGGETISPVEVEQVLAAHPAFAEVAVVGVPDASWGEIVTACVVVRPGRRRARRRRAASLVLRSPGLVQASPAGRGARRAPPHRRHRPGPTHPHRRTPGW